MNRLAENFTYNKYGIEVRLADLGDSLFILSLRRSKRGQILHSTNSDLEQQIEWMKEYKKREKKGEEYYLIYSYEGKPFGVNRIIEIDYNKKSCEGGSWLCSEDTPFERAFATLVIVNEIKFEIIGVDYSLGYTAKKNKQIQKLGKLLGWEVTGETEKEIFYRCDKGPYLNGVEKIKKILLLTD